MVRYGYHTMSFKNISMLKIAYGMLTYQIGFRPDSTGIFYMHIRIGILFLCSACVIIRTRGSALRSYHIENFFQDSNKMKYEKMSKTNLLSHRPVTWSTKKFEIFNQSSIGSYWSVCILPVVAVSEDKRRIRYIKLKWMRATRQLALFASIPFIST